MYIWNSMQQLHDALIQMPDLHSSPTFNGNTLYWDLYKDAYIRAYCNDKDFYIEIVGIALSNSGSVRWLADKSSMLQELYSLGKREICASLRKRCMVPVCSTWAAHPSTRFLTEEAGISERKNTTLAHLFIWSKSKKQRGRFFAALLLFSSMV